MAAIFLVYYYSLYMTLFVLPGFAVILGTSSRMRLSKTKALLIIVCTSGVLGYASFWCFFANKSLGKGMSFMVYGTALILVSRAMYRSTEARRTAKELARPLLFVFITGICYLSLFYLFSGPQKQGAGLADVRFFEQIRPGDNLIPFIFAEKIYGHLPLKPFCCGDWLSSDRPPLQAGIFLLLRPLRFGCAAEVQYQLIGCLLQTLWLCGVWCVLLSLRTVEQRVSQILALMSLSGFLFYNSVYVWPKLLAACFIFFALTIFFEALLSRRAITTRNMIAGTICIALAVLAHPGSVFSLFIFLFVLVTRPWMLNIRQVGLGVCVLCAFLLPWTAYQKYFDPPGNRLLKMHLAGAINIDQRSFGRALADAYSQRSFSQIWQNKYSNLKMLFGNKPFDSYGLTALKIGRKDNLNRGVTEESRIVQREYIWNALGILNIGWISGLIILLRPKHLKSGVPYSGWLATAAAANLIVWCLLLFGPSGTFTTHSSYADILLICVSLSGWIVALPSLVQLIVIGLQVFNLLVVWTWSLPSTFFPKNGSPQISLVILGAMCIAVLVAIFMANLFRRSSCGSSLNTL